MYGSGALQACYRLLTLIHRRRYRITNRYGCLIHGFVYVRSLRPLISELLTQLGNTCVRQGYGHPLPDGGQDRVEVVAEKKRKASDGFCAGFRCARAMAVIAKSKTAEIMMIRVGFIVASA